MKLPRGLIWPVEVKVSLRGFFGVSICENETYYLGTLRRQGLK